MTQLRLAVVGAGWVLEHAYAGHLASRRGIEVVSLFDADAPRAAKMACRLGLNRAAGSVDECLDSHCDGVLILTPPAEHLPNLVRSLAADKFVLCEKPVVGWYSEWLSIDRALAMHRVMGSATMRFRRDIQQLLLWIEDGLIGPVRHVRLVWRRGAGVPAPGSWRTDPRLAPTGVLDDLAPHLIDILLGLLDSSPVRSATVIDATLECRFGSSAKAGQWFAPAATSSGYAVPDFARVLLSLRGGASAEVEVSWAEHEANDETVIEVVGVDGTAAFDGLVGFSTSRRRPGQVCRLVPRRGPARIVHYSAGPMLQLEAFRRSLERFAGMCHGMSTPLASWSDIGFAASCLSGVRSHLGMGST